MASETTELAAQDTPTKPARRVRAVDHALDVLDALGRAYGAVGVTELARQTGLSKAAVHHLLATLESRNLVAKDSETSRYRLSWGLYELGAKVVRDVDLPRIARPHLDRLAAHTGESVLLGILDEDTVLYLDRGEAPTGLQMRANAGRRGPLHATASGKVLLAFASDATLFERLLAAPLARFTATTVTDPSTLRNELAGVRSEGYAVCWQEREVGLCSLAVPLRDYTGNVVGSLAVAGPASRLTKRTLHAHLVPLQSAGRRIEVQLGGAKPSS
ncbi:IclR family transcriptional regulator [Pseudonocardia sp. CA-107938]|uniref:IclR family transcriptional regulator n=1 Tax=Pseudonocardia sp. CA-107938 TaxID=3240021 RepID=UPI003D8B268F